MIIFLDYIFGMKSSLPFFLTNKRFILSILILFFLLVCGKDNTCDQGDWNGDCAGWDNIQRFAFNDAKELAVSTTKNYLALFCLLAGPNIFY
jgi:hypothetical protein